ncbi:hypothetical protein NKT34_11305 [Paenibacillus polysaccharolyticus]|uniref:Lipoprotein n=1 Tax=Paenibacillus cucumis (ex Kampfer et al. 2016) TaxID=1776858 RepID=A0ABS7KGU6_9BACL|nr:MULTISPECIES: hypothetical protein [Paenibacillus]MBY0203176.1 hypothetical protein [Paenibacillus cucumis (ex Kampfer et al. 2016)]MCP1133879.1 hypothetical protein [Paenibacillus polysaccharolyticus]MDP9697818.1 hypothetical protein [Paenibacillus intestini]
MKEIKQNKTKIKNIWILLLLSGLLIIFSACGMTEDVVNDELDREKSKQNTAHESDGIVVEVLVESDVNSASDLEVEINARKNPESVYWDTIEVPYKDRFVIPKDTFIPLLSTHVRAKADDSASWISCSIWYDGELVASHKSRGSDAKAVCEKKFQLGPG